MHSIFLLWYHLVHDKRDPDYLSHCIFSIITFPYRLGRRFSMPSDVWMGPLYNMVWIYHCRRGLTLQKVKFMFFEVF